MSHVADGRADRPSERAMHLLWQRAHTLSDGLRTEDGRRFRVVYPGRLNTREGPDFRDAVIATDAGELVRGDVELHVDAASWRGHGHQRDPNYGDVMLHVVVSPAKRGSRNRGAGEGPPIVPLRTMAPLLESVDNPAPEAEPLIRQLDLGGRRLDDALDEAGDQRFLARSKGFARSMAHGDAEQVLYSAVMDALGYASNRAPFRELAERLPVRCFAVLRREPPATRVLALEAMLLRCAGLLDQAYPLEEAALMRRLLKLLPGPRARVAGGWRLFRVRPANHPAKRIVGAAHLLDRHAGSGLVRSLAAEVRTREDSRLLASLMVPPFVGRGRAADIAVNVALPFLHAWAKMRVDRGLEEASVALYRGFPMQPENEITREMRRLLGRGRGPVRASTARRQQGLMRVYRDMVNLPGRSGTGALGGGGRSSWAAAPQLS